MDDRLKRFMGEGIPPFLLEKLHEHVDVYAGEKVTLFLPKTDIDFLKGVHCHRDYEFFSSAYTYFPMEVEKKKIFLDENYFIPINPGQYHGAWADTANFRVMLMFIDKDLINKISISMYGRGEVVFENDSFKPGPEMQHLMKLFVEESKNKQSGYEFVLDSISTYLAVCLLRFLKNDAGAVLNFDEYVERRNINRSIEFLTEYYNNEFSLKDVAKIANLSPYHFIRVFKAQTGKTPYSFLMDVKIEKAIDLLKNSKRSITEICYMCGFNNLSHFITVFKKKTGTSPSKFRSIG